MALPPPVRDFAARSTERHVNRLRRLNEAALKIGWARTEAQVLATVKETVHSVLEDQDATTVESEGGKIVVECFLGDEMPVLDDGESPLQPERLVLPLLNLEGRVLATMVLKTTRGPGFSDEDEALATQLARLGAQQLGTVGLFEREHVIATTLQASLLPTELPPIEGATVAARFRSGGAGVEVGGDWYDVFVLPEGLIGLVIGDVVGKGVRAAATMGQLRSTLRACLSITLDPAEALVHLDRQTMLIDGENFATVICATCDPRRGAVRWVSAGHPPPLLVRADRSTEFLEGHFAPPISTLVEAEYSVATCELRPGDTFVLYTDGLVERRGESIDSGMGDLSKLAASAPIEIEAFVDAVLACAENDERHDDVALLALQITADR